MDQRYLTHPDFDPVLVSLNLFGLDLAIRWYALAYIVGFVIGWRLLVMMLRRPALWGGTPPMAAGRADDLLTWIVLGVILGGRLGFVLVYQPGYYLQHPIEILYVWRGGMAFHGGFVGAVIATALYCRHVGAPMLRLGDAVAVATPPGLFLGRVANFVNGELWGRPTEQPWGMVFAHPAAQICPDGWMGVCARHPSQLYQAGMEGLILGAVLLWGVWRRGWLGRPGLALGVFVAGYGLARLIGEAFRQADPQFVSPDNPAGHVLRLGEGAAAAGLTMGQLLSLPMLAAGLLILVWAASRPRTAP